MKLHIRFDENAGEHTYLTVFVNGANAGHLVLRQCEAIWLHSLLMLPVPSDKQDIRFSGRGPAIVEKQHECSSCVGTGHSGMAARA